MRTAVVCVLALCLLFAAGTPIADDATKKTKALRGRPNACDAYLIWSGDERIAARPNS